MVTRILERPTKVAKLILEKNWKELPQPHPNFYLLKDQNDIPFGAPDEGSIWFIESSIERDKTADILRKHDDVRCPFKIEIHANTDTRLDYLYGELVRIQAENLVDPGRDLTPSNDTFDEWELLESPYLWQDRNRYNALLNCEMIIYCQRIR